MRRKSASQAHTARIGAPGTLDRLVMPGITVQAVPKSQLRMSVHQGTTAQRNQKHPGHARKDPIKWEKAL